MTQNIPDLAEVARKIEAQEARATRRVEIYESDGDLLWAGAGDVPRIIEGTISVDYDRDERRTVELTFDNRDGALDHSPSGFWYDKIIKVFRGVEYTRHSVNPRILLARDEGNVMRSMLQKLGYNNVYTFEEMNNGISYTSSSNKDAYFQNPADILVYYRPVTVPWNPASAYDSLQVAWGNLTQNAIIIASNPFGGAYPTDAHDVALGAVSVDKVNRDSPVDLGWGGYISDTPPPVPVSGADNYEIYDPDNFGPSTTTQGGVQNRWALQTITADINSGQPVKDYVVTYATEVIGVGTGVIGGVGRSFNSQMVEDFVWSRDQLNLVRQAIEWMVGRDTEEFWEAQIGEFMIDSIKEPHFPHVIQVTGRDYTKKLINSKFEVTTTFKSGQSVNTVVESIARNAGISKFLLAANDAQLNTNLTFERESSRWEAIKAMCEAHSIEVFFGPGGHLTLRTFQDPITSPSSLTLQTGTEGNLVSYTKSSADSRIYNVINVISENGVGMAEGALYSGRAENNQPTSPTRIARLGRRNMFYNTSILTSNDACAKLARDLLKVNSLEEFNLDFQTHVYAWLEAGEILEFIDPTPGRDEPNRFLFTSFTIPLTLGPMSGIGKRITIVGQASTPGVVPQTV